MWFSFVLRATGRRDDPSAALREPPWIGPFGQRMMDGTKRRVKMGMDRGKIEAAYREIRRLTDSCDWNGWADLFAEDGTFINSTLEEPIRGRAALRSFAADWPSTIVNRAEWVVVDGNRLVVAWNERQRDDAPAYRGFSTFVFNDDGLVESYEGMFDTAAVVAAIGS
jgi:hypothetical protein